MKLLLDQGLPRSAAALLRAKGIDAVHVGEIGMSAAEDAMILLEAKEAARIVATLDADFHRLLALSGESLPSVIRIRLEGLRGNEAASLLEDVLARCGTELAHGALVTVQSGRLRIRRLPLSFPP